jgi:SAM-dependent methyltransferase
LVAAQSNGGVSMSNDHKQASQIAYEEERERYVVRLLNVARACWRARNYIAAVKQTFEALRYSPIFATGVVLRKLSRRTGKAMTSVYVRGMQRVRGRRGDPRRTAPISREFGFDRGRPIDRYYIERFLARYSDDIRGRILEVGDNLYTLRYGGTRVEKSDILYVDNSNPNATFVGDLADPRTLPLVQFDCIILTQTLHLLFDMRAGLSTLYRALKPGGVLLLTTPGITQTDSTGGWGRTWYWSLTSLSLRRLLEKDFSAHTVHIESHGNVFAAAAFLYGLAVEDVNTSDLDADDPSYPVTIAARAMKAK